MQRLPVKRSAIVSLVALLSLVVTPLAATGSTFAEEIPPIVTTNSDVSSTSTENTSNKTTANPTQQDQQSDQKLKQCQFRETVINSLLRRLADRGQKHLELFTIIANRVEAFYAKSGKTVSNYSALVADVNAKEAAAQSTVNTVKSEVGTFNCSQVHTFVGTFLDALKSEINALQAYRTSIRNLTVAVKSAVGESTSTTNQANGGTQ